MAITSVRQSKGPEFNSRSGQVAYFHGVNTSNALNIRDVGNSRNCLSKIAIHIITTGEARIATRAWDVSGFFR